MIDRMEERFGMSKERIGEGIDLLLQYRYLAIRRIL